MSETDCKNLMPEINEQFEGAVEWLMEFPKNIKNIVKGLRKISRKEMGIPTDERITVTVKRGLLILQCKNDGSQFQKKIPVKTYGLSEPISFDTIPLYFYQAVTPESLMGCKRRGEDHYVLYFKDKKCEYLVCDYEGFSY